MAKNRAQQRAKQKRQRDKIERRNAERMRKIRAGATVAAVVALGLVLFLVFRSDDSGTNPTASPTKPGSTTGTDNQSGGDAACGGKARGAYKERSYKSAPKMAIDPSKTYTATLETSCGTIVVALDAKKSPKTVNNFVFLAREGYYDNTIFHRVIKSFMMQGGDPKGTGTGGPGYTIPDEYDETHVYDKPGLLAMARTNAPNSGGSQFFITEVPYPSLNGQYTIFGRVLSGQEVVTKVADLPKDGEKPKQDVVLYKVTITEK